MCCALLMKHGLLWHPDTTDHNSVRNKNRTGPCLLNLAALHSPKKEKIEECVAGKLQPIKTERSINAFVIVVNSSLAYVFISVIQSTNHVPEAPLDKLGRFRSRALINVHLKHHGECV